MRGSGMLSKTGAGSIFHTPDRLPCLEVPGVAMEEAKVETRLKDLKKLFESASNNKKKEAS